MFLFFRKLGVPDVRHLVLEQCERRRDLLARAAQHLSRQLACIDLVHFFSSRYAANSLLVSMRRTLSSCWSIREIMSETK